MNNCTVIDHPILQYKLTLLRNKETTGHSFRSIMSEMSSLIAYEAMRDLKLKDTNIETPIEQVTSKTIGEDLLVAAIYRAGNAMLDGILRTAPFAKVGHIGIYRDKFINNTVEYYFKLPNNHQGKKLFLVDPLLATGNTTIAACDRLKEYNVGKIIILSVLVSKNALDKLNETHPDVHIYTTAIEKGLTENGYLIPGIGDAGDRIYGTL